MPTDITTTPGGKTGKSSDTKSKESKSGNQRKTQVIMEFLGGCTPYEADALRAMLSIATGKSTLETMPQYDRSALNRYLNFGCDKETEGVDGIRAHRQKRALGLMKSVSQYVGKEEIIDITTALLTVSSDRQDIQTVLNSLPKLQTPGSGANAGNTSSNVPIPK
ncbi:MAG: hypothetical protein JFT10_11980 [Muribaculaceae bacterium]|uniref:Uncharacterized protein n=1 Tax=Duncaniella dubosii TaxID=2518971 RepID=A0A4P7W3I8_9BACT|nr:hypothetical protein [Duncaniella dubosii]MBJ2191546.1 hypothetical protein [Muribaculaceae bacterium]QCD42589.1 hypothetical protein E7747_10040 [Duncaniella dubosii]